MAAKKSTASKKGATRKKAVVKKSVIKKTAKKRAVSKKGAVKKGSSNTFTALLSATPVNNDHGNAIKALKQAVTSFERAEKAVATTVNKLEQAKAKAAKARANAASRKTAAAKNAVIRAREAVAAANALLSEKKVNMKATKADIVDATTAIRLALRKESAKQRAISDFAVKWEKQYDRKMNAKAKLKKSAKKKASAKKAVTTTE